MRFFFHFQQQAISASEKRRKTVFSLFACVEQDEKNSLSKIEFISCSKTIFFPQPICRFSVSVFEAPGAILSSFFLSLHRVHPRGTNATLLHYFTRRSIELSNRRKVFAEEARRQIEKREQSIFPTRRLQLGK